MRNPMRFAAATTLVVAIGIGAAVQPASAAQNPAHRAVVVGSVETSASTSSNRHASLHEVSPTTAPTAIDRHAVESELAPVTHRAVPAIVAYAVYLIVRFGIPWLIRYAYGVFTSVFLNQSIKLLVCQKLRESGNPWGWSTYCPR